jgi:hypothetical protein
MHLSAGGVIAAHRSSGPLYRDYLRKRRAEEPSVPGPAALARARGERLPGQLQPPDPLYHLDADRPHLSPRRAARLLLTRPDRLAGGLDLKVATAALPLPYHNGRTEGASNKTIMWNLNCQVRGGAIARTIPMMGVSGCDRSGCSPMAWSVSRPRAKAGFLMLAATLGGPGRTRPGLHRR